MNHYDKKIKNLTALITKVCTKEKIKVDIQFKICYSNLEIRSILFEDPSLQYSFFFPSYNTHWGRISIKIIKPEIISENLKAAEIEFKNVRKIVTSINNILIEEL